MVLDGPTNHLDLESITSLNKALVRHPGTLIFSSHDQEFARSIADRVIEITPEEVIDHHMSYDVFLEKREEQLRARERAEADAANAAETAGEAGPAAGLPETEAQPEAAV